MDASGVSAKKRIVVLYTGGTIGMKSTANGLAANGGFEDVLFEYLATAPVIQQAQIVFRELQPVIDSASMTPDYWLALRDVIVEVASNGRCAGVIILHGTDTLAYSAAALAFHLIGLQAPVVFTGSMLPVGVENSDAWENIDGALALVVGGVDNGVWVHFHGQTILGTRCSKVRSVGRGAFAEAARARMPTAYSSLPAELDYSVRKIRVEVAALSLYPGMGACVLHALVAQKVQGIVLECYGSGTGPCDDPGFIEALQVARDNGVVVIAITQCAEGGVELGTYVAGSALLTAGVVTGGTITREAALGKLHVLLGAGLPADQVSHLFALGLCGE
ncbi:asparaginase [Pseudomonas fulva]|uniref:asparaginase n=1 Tax=Pseudomonas fulva TaxID=47880 RepID=UPI003CF8074F